VRIARLFLAGITALPAAFPLKAQEKPRVFIAVNPVRRSQAYKDPVYRESTTSIDDRSVEISRDFSESCKEVTVNANRKKADYIARFSGTLGRNRVAIYRPDGDLVGGAEKGTLAGAVKAACEIMKKDHLRSASNTEEKPSDSAK
jgi:hypothetical protein